VVFIDGALPGETVQALIVRSKNQWEAGTLHALARSSTLRVQPPCPHFGLERGACGGCKVQHVDPLAQVAIKQRALEDVLHHIGKVRAAQILPPIIGPSVGYRHRARLSVRYVKAKEVVLVGFHERQSRYVADIQRCSVLAPQVSALLLPLRDLIASLEERDRLPQIEVAVGEDLRSGKPAPSIALVLRHLAPLGEADKARLREFAARHAEVGVQWWLQPKGPDTVCRLDGNADAGLDLVYRLPESQVVMPFKPTDFTQVNAAINRVLVDRALRLLKIEKGDRVIDWFCGLGNFSLPLARKARMVLGIEGSDALVARAQENARLNGLAEKASFVARNLFEIGVSTLQADGAADLWLVDPPREGALALCKALADAIQGEAALESTESSWTPPRRIVYVSCNPATLARDAGLLVHQAGYRCTHAGVVNMFPHTAHVESIAVFER
jgi:23S rRNA (uracil1939-C5)-methyltransferase